MGNISIFENVTLDGVVQAPAAPDEDTRGGFEHGGWALPYSDPELGKAAGASMANSEALLLGRRTYEHFFSVWPNRTDNPFTEVLNKTQKYVASRSLSEPLPWQNSTLLPGDAADSIPEIKARHEKSVVILGSRDLVQSLMQRDLIDEYILLIHPLVLGSGRRLFADGQLATLSLANTATTSTGVMVATYRRAA